MDLSFDQFAINLAEKGLVPEPFLRRGIIHLLGRRLHQEKERYRDPEQRWREWLRHMASAPIALVPEEANAQHYEIPSAFYQKVLGPHLKYSSGYWESADSTLVESEEAMLQRTCDMAQLADGQEVLELGCGWGSLSLWMASHFPQSRITAVSNSGSQREFILARAMRRGIGNLQVLTADMNQFQTEGRFDRVVSVEMFEHMRNWEKLLTRAKGWLKPGGKLFLHVFAHSTYAYPFEEEGGDDWMSRHFFSGGMMPSVDLPLRLHIPFHLEETRVIPGTHYARTSEAWHSHLLSRRAEIEALFGRTLAPAEAKRQVERWRLFFLACAELFGYRQGREWVVAHHRLSPKEKP